MTDKTHTLPSFTQLTDLAAERFGGKALACSDDFFAEMQNMLKSGRGVFIPDKYTERGKWMDGWESRRKRTEGHDWCIVELGAEGIIYGVDIDTNHFTGNYPPFASIEATNYPPFRRNSDGAVFDLEKAVWTEILPKSPLNGGSQNFYDITHQGKWTHLKLHIYPDGGVARFKVYGEVAKNWDTATADDIIDLAAATNGGKAIACNDEYFSHKENINMPNRGANMGDGWETKRNRTPNNRDWLILRLARKGFIKKILVDTCHYKGNYPDRCRLEGCNFPLENDFLLQNTEGVAWTPILPEMKLQADHEHYFEHEILTQQAFTHVRLTIFPDGGISRLRLFGTVEKGVFTLAEINEITPPLFESYFTKCCDSTAWVEKMAALRPFQNRADFFEKANNAWFSCKKNDWLEAFTHHPRIGDMESLKKKFATTATWASGEQGRVKEANETVLQALKTYNDKYFEKFGFIFIVFATGKSAEEMLSILKERYDNELVEEILNAALEQQKITQLRLEKLVL